MSTGDGPLATTREENGEVCVTVGSVTRTAGTYWSSRLKAKGAGC